MTGLAALTGLALLLVRPGMLVLATPFLGAVNAPPQVRVGLTVLVAVILASTVSVPATVPAGGLPLVILREMAIGLALALAVRVLIFAAEFTGHFTGYQIGLSLGSLIDPATGVRNNILAILYAQLATVIVLVTNAHHAMLRALADSYTALPIGLGGIGATLGESVSRMLGLVFVLGFRLAMPIVVVLLLVELALGLTARVAPSLNVIVAGAPVRLVVGLLVVAASLSMLPGLITRYVPTVLDLGSDLAGAFR
jgi:flagellar biosynthetic protein FliR